MRLALKVVMQNNGDFVDVTPSQYNMCRVSVRSGHTVRLPYPTNLFCWDPSRYTNFSDFFCDFRHSLQADSMVVVNRFLLHSFH